MNNEIDLLKNYPKTKRDPKSRASEKTEEDRIIARQFGKEFFDGERRHGYGGVYYDPRFWEPVIPDFVKLTESFGHVGLKVEKPEDLESAMKKCFELKDKLVFLDIVIDEDEHVYPMLEAGMAMDSMWLDKKTKTWE